jgi:CHASE3 domain sensor protein
MIDGTNINQGTVVFLVIAIVFLTLILVVSYEKAKRLSPGYPVKY